MTLALRREILINLVARLTERFTTNIYTALLPIIAIALAESPQFVQLTVSAYLIGLSLSELLGGLFYSEDYDWVVITASGFIIIGSLVIIIFQNDSALLMGRFIQGLGAGCLPVIANASLAEIAHKFEITQTNLVTIRIFSRLSFLSTWYPAFAMYIGGLIGSHYNWEISSWILIIISLINSVVYYAFTNIPKKLSEFKVTVNFRRIYNYVLLLKHKEFMTRSVGFALIVSGITAYYLLSPFVFNRDLHIKAHTIGLLSFDQITAYFIGKNLSPYCYAHYGEKKLSILVCLLSLLSGLALLTLNILFKNNLILILLPMAFYSFSAGILAPYVNVNILRVMPHLASAAEGLFNILIAAINVVVSLVITQFKSHLILYLGSLWIILSIGALVCFKMMNSFYPSNKL